VIRSGTRRRRRRRPGWRARPGGSTVGSGVGACPAPGGAGWATASVTADPARGAGGPGGGGAVVVDRLTPGTDQKVVDHGAVRTTCVRTAVENAGNGGVAVRSQRALTRRNGKGRGRCLPRPTPYGSEGWGFESLRARVGRGSSGGRGIATTPLFLDHDPRSDPRTLLASRLWPRSQPRSTGDLGQPRQFDLLSSL